MSLDTLRTALTAAQSEVSRLSGAEQAAQKRKTEIEDKIRELGLTPDNVKSEAAEIVRDATEVVAGIQKEVEQALEETQR